MTSISKVFRIPEKKRHTLFGGLFYLTYLGITDNVVDIPYYFS